MGTKKTLIIVFTLILLVAALFAFRLSSRCPNFDQAKLVLDNNHEFSVSLATTPGEQQRGLSGCPKLAGNQGVFFIFPPQSTPSFWMKDMLVPIDIIWIADGAIVGIERDVPLPTNTKDLPLYHPPQPIDAALEVKSGRADELNLQIGSVYYIDHEGKFQFP